MDDSIAVRRTVWLFVALGVAVRSVRYLLMFPLWQDEYKLADNLLDRNFLGLLLPLDHNQVAPIGFLWIELAVTRWLGFSEWALRLIPFLCAIGSVFLFRYVAVRLLAGLPLVLSVAIFSVSYYPIRYAGEVKPYAVDLATALAFLALMVGWWQNRERTGWLWRLAVIAPLCLSVSFTSVFVAGGVSLAIAYTLWREMPLGRNAPGWIAWGGFNLVVAAAFLGLHQLSISTQYNASRAGMVNCWSDGFPPWRQPLELLFWLVREHSSVMFAYPIGGENFGSIPTAIAFFTGLVALWHMGRRDLLVVVAGCFGLSLIAALLHRYPYGGHARLSQYLAPVICLTAGCGAARLLQALPDARWRRAAPQFAVVICGLIGLGSAVRDFVQPWKSRVDYNHRELARKIWTSDPHTPVVSVQSQQGLRIYREEFEVANCSCQTFEALSRSRYPGQVEPARLDADRPIRCVIYHGSSARRDEIAYSAWISSMLERYDLVSTETRQFPLVPPGDHQYDGFLLCYDEYRFVPKQTSGGAPRLNLADNPPKNLQR